MTWRQKHLAVWGTALLLGVLVFIFVRDASGRLGLIIGILAVVVGAYAVLPTTTPPPRLHVEYRARGRPSGTVDRLNTYGDETALSYLVVVCNEPGAGVAEALEVTFDTGGGEVYNEAGNWPGPDLNQAVTPPRYHDPSRVLNPGDERPIASLTWHRHSSRPTGPLRWTVRAKGVAPRTGEAMVNVAPAEG